MSDLDRNGREYGIFDDAARIFGRIGENQEAWREAMAPHKELCLLQAEDMARRVAEAFSDGTLRDVSDLRPLVTRFEESLRDANHGAAERGLSIEERLSFCRALLRMMPALAGQSAQPATPTPLPATVSMLENPFFAEAGRRFSRVLGEMTPFTVPAFTDVCEAVAADNAQFGILPLEDSSDGKLYHFYEQADRFELHVSHTCDVPYHDSSRTLRFALLYRNLPPVTAVAGEQMLECTLFEEERHTLSDLLTAALDCGLSLRRIDSLPAPYIEDGFFYHPVFRAEGGDTAMFEAFLRCFMPRAAVTERYIHLK